ncbi:hypothetical protein MSG28_014428 [Choristoneura fumiferana]|uniref:Uncharacterized protein n=1 Tax=Choristoneura fumiferana TaxID=7141 RepID=A0ACC0JRE5_CHOFU|nr:hypothetical protein MSG28_014428 [Choristoneura fumiferana]
MPKRSIEEKIEKLNSKIRKLENKRTRKRVRFISSCSDSSEANNQDAVNEQAVTDDHQDDAQLTGEHTQQPPVLDPEVNRSEVVIDPEPQPSISKEAVSAEEVGLDPELLQALGESTSDTPEYGQAIHESLAKLWLPVLRKGLAKDNIDNLLRHYLIPDNCKLLQAPKLNAEISAAVSEVVRGRDKKLNGFQQQLGAGVTAINRGMEILLSNNNKAQALKHLSDACRVLTDLHHSWTKDRIKLITPSLEKNFHHVIQDAERDETLFGNSLSEKIKASQVITRQGLQIKKNTTNYKTTSVASQPTTTRSTPQGNWRGPPRYQSSRGGRGSYKKVSQTQRAYNPTPAPARPPPQYKPRPPPK